MNINEILLLAKQKGIYRGEIKLVIVGGVIKDVEYLVQTWEQERPNIDGITKG